MPNLLLLMTPGVGLNTWEKIGIFNRELKPYINYVNTGWNVKILTFDKGQIPELPDGIEAITFPNRLLLWFLPWSHKRLGAWADIIKTNQSHHVYFYSNAAVKWNKPIYLRCGYVHGEYLETTNANPFKTLLYKWLEKKAFNKATHCQVPTEDLSNWVTNNYLVSKDKISVIPNFVDTNIFRPIKGILNKPKSVISVGRLEPVKRLDLLIKACAQILGCQLTLIGDGPERDNLSSLAKNLGLQLTFTGNLPHESLSEIIQKHTVFAITSEREGHPKALIEAMACGIPCLGVEVSGIQNVLRHRKNGLLVKPTISKLVEGLNELFQNSELRTKLSLEALKYIEDNFSFDACFSHEYRIVQHMLA